MLKRRSESKHRKIRALSPGSLIYLNDAPVKTTHGLLWMMMCLGHVPKHSEYASANYD